MRTHSVRDAFMSTDLDDILAASGVLDLAHDSTTEAIETALAKLAELSADETPPRRALLRWLEERTFSATCEESGTGVESKQTGRET